MATQKQALAFEDAVIDLLTQHLADGLDADAIKRALEYQALNVHELAADLTKEAPAQDSGHSPTVKRLAREFSEGRFDPH